MMVESIIITLLSLVIILIIGYSMGQSDKLMLEREYFKLKEIIEHFKDQRNDVFVDDKGMIIYYPLEEENFIK